MFVYQMSWPIDYFGLMVNFKDYFDKCCSYIPGEVFEEHYESPDYMRNLLFRFLRRLTEVETYWEGDIRGNDLYIGSVPDDEGTSSSFFIALKQDNNGSSFMVSQFPFMHLEEFYITQKRKHPITQLMQTNVDELVDRFAPIKKGEEDMF